MEEINSVTIENDENDLIQFLKRPFVQVFNFWLSYIRNIFFILISPYLLCYYVIVTFYNNVLRIKRLITLQVQVRILELEIITPLLENLQKDATVETMAIEIINTIAVLPPGFSRRLLRHLCFIIRKEAMISRVSIDSGVATISERESVEPSEIPTDDQSDDQSDDQNYDEFSNSSK